MENGDSIPNQKSLPAPVDVRLWPAWVILVGEACAVVLPGLVAPGTRFMFFSLFLGVTLGTLAFLIWWLAASRAPWKVRGIVLVGFLTLCIATGVSMDRSMGYALFMYGIPFATAVWVGVLALTRSVSWFQRTTLVLLSVLAMLSLAQLFRQEGTDGSLRPILVLRWQPRQEDAALEALREHSRSAPPDAGRDFRRTPTFGFGLGQSFAVPIATARSSASRSKRTGRRDRPSSGWRRPVGPGWSSFAVIGDRVCTQEQRGDEEAVVCYDMASGAEIWAHLDPAKFNEPMGGVGPRATPTVVDDKLYALGAEGNVNCLEPATGQLLWSSSIASDTGAKLPEWGFASSPLVVGDLVVVYAGAPNAGMIAYNRLSGQKVWTCPAGSHSYSSAQHATLENDRTDLDDEQRGPHGG